MNHKKHIIITGSSRGIGLALVKVLANLGHYVLALSRNTDPIRTLQNNMVTYFPFDITHPKDLDTLYFFLEKEWKRVDILINNAGKLIHKPFSETFNKEFESIFKVNVFGVAEIIKKTLPFMPSDGHVVTISSMGGIQGSNKFPGLSAYSSSKGAVITLTELLAEEYKETGPFFNALALGAVQTEMLQKAFPDYKAPVTAEEMASYIAHFALNGHHFYNGKTLQVANTTP